MKRGIFCILLGVSLYFFVVFLQEELKKQIPPGIQITVDESRQLTFDKLNNASLAGAFKEEKGSIRTTLEPCYFLATSNGYSKAIGLSYTDGGYFSTAKNTNSIPYGVIPKSLSVRLFGEEQAIGKTLDFDGTPYEICGVYEDGGFFTRFAQSTLPLIYTSLPLNGDLSAKNIYYLMLNNDKYDTDALVVQEASRRLKLNIREGKKGSKTIVSYVTLHQLGDSILQIGLVFYGFFFVWLLFFLSYKQGMYLYDRQQPGNNTLHGLFFICGFALAFLLIYSLFSRIRIPPQYLPANNLFDVSFYQERIATLKYQVVALGGVEYFARTSLFFLQLEVMVLSIGTIFFWIGGMITFRKIRKLKGVREVIG